MTFRLQTTPRSLQIKGSHKIKDLDRSDTCIVATNNHRIMAGRAQAPGGGGGPLFDWIVGVRSSTQLCVACGAACAQVGRHWALGSRQHRPFRFGPGHTVPRRKTPCQLVALAHHPSGHHAPRALRPQTYRHDVRS